MFDPEVRAAYVEALRDAAHAHAVCEEYRAAATRDWEHDTADRLAGRRINALSSPSGVDEADLAPGMPPQAPPLTIWGAWADNVEGSVIDAGHFFPEEVPRETATALDRFFGA